ncbi:MAG: hypothetical protein WBO43_02910 [Gemmatimonadota bacterium]|jgi:hypothetical protein
MNNDRWPIWMRALRPDELTRRRMRRSILDEALPLLTARRDSWFDAVAEWATILSPIAAAVTLVFAGLALRQAGSVELSDTVASAPAVEELVRPGETLPSAFGPDSVPDLDAVMTVLYENELP